MYPIDPRSWLHAEDIQPFVFTQSRDLAATDGSLKTAEGGKYVIFEETPTKGQMLVVKAVVPWAMERQNVGTPLTETVGMCAPANVNGQVSFEPLVGSESPILFDSKNPAFKDAANASNKDLTGGKGITFISADPWADAARAWYNPMFTFIVPSGTTLRVTFSVLRPSVTNPLPAVYTVPPVVGAARRIDFAGVVVTGLTMPEQVYARIADDVRRSAGA
jgi:hypothetical protein